MSIKEGDFAVINVWPKQGRIGQVVLAVEDSDGWHYNLWMCDTGDCFGYDAGEVTPLSEYVYER